ncbi:hypothetical protein [Dyadobacter sp. LHD-138]|uniref:hypothetical protein n=1 Tax=Dyadobacter sp. LHD-138 TaxID=3071413 RepID=UPI0027E09310|nr:hypothetical protein [Dyadobacter sp. LHD-138]MDQ6478168.1 hypothetical protein [Dyadobacter sp. LHD-138]
MCGFYRFKAGREIKEEDRSLREESRALEFLPAHKEDLKYQLEEKKAFGSALLDNFGYAKLVTLSLILQNS